MVLIKDYL